MNVRYGQPQRGLDTLGMAGDVGLGVGLGIPENKSKVVGGWIEMN